jgi:hypothetical protein
MDRVLSVVSDALGYILPVSRIPLSRSSRNVMLKVRTRMLTELDNNI